MPPNATITVNGDLKPLAAGQTLRALIESLGLAAQPVAAEVNGTLVPRREHESHELKPDDKIELVSLVGGG
jgi:sulfur carrier protein